MIDVEFGGRADISLEALPPPPPPERENTHTYTHTQTNLRTESKYSERLLTKILPG